MSLGAARASADRTSLVLGLSSRVPWPVMSVNLEMDDAIRAAESADHMSVELRTDRANRIEPILRNAVRLSKLSRLARSFRGQADLPTGYDVLYAGVISFRDLWVLAGADLPSVASKRICCITEIWEPDLHHFEMYAEILEQFDVVYLSCQGTVDALSEMVSVPVHWIPSATDALTRCPADEQPRCIDVMSVGRRCPVQHAELLDAARSRRMTYQFDSLRGAQLADWSEHRFVLGEQTRRSRFYVCHRSKFDDTEETGDVQEFGGRYFDAFAAGAIPIGDLPDADHFRSTFPRPGSTVFQASGQDGMVDTVLEMKRDIDALDEVARLNVVEALRGHDWVHRWETMLAGVGLDLVGHGQERRRGLDELADVIAGGDPVDGARSELARSLARSDS